MLHVGHESTPEYAHYVHEQNLRVVGDKSEVYEICNRPEHPVLFQCGDKLNFDFFDCLVDSFTLHESEEKVEGTNCTASKGGLHK